ncbi:uncharacterized protein LOC131425143 [Malaya genurostris]|uniref:uncharacterized protein LOC131425143 n=1 Tax=Malaya genurostris TaxID=325434 RepID=UPI0026F3D708|nr:uncharacterized protein LOC131425143 [Malaya genurostris]XP_058442747.1 uncharacterized protein LOC131425143 [Malaya genurostris]XP_058442749.1 uncharacterized protein LOC131425143 [Malaya genurostris]
MDMCKMSSRIPRRQLMKHVIINATCLLIICAAAAAPSPTRAEDMVKSGIRDGGNERKSTSRTSRVQSISDYVGAGNRPDNKQPLSVHRNLLLERKFYENNHDKTLSPVKSDYGIKDLDIKRNTQFSTLVRWKRNSNNFSTNSNFNILNLSNKNLSNAKQLADELSNYSHMQSNYEISHYYNLSDISALDLSRNNLSGELPTIVQRNFSTLSWLDLSENNLTTAEKLTFPSLKYLNLSCNSIKRFSSSHLRNLTRLDLSQNSIASSASLSPLLLRKLTDLDLSCNQLETLGKSFLFQIRALKRLDFSDNAIKRLNRSIFYNLINLEQLNLAGNQIDVIENDTFAYLLNLQFLDLSRNNIGPGSIRALQGIPALIGLSLANNVRLGPVLHEFVASWSLKELDASGTGLCKIPTALAQSVKSLKLANNLLNVIRCGDLDSYPLLQQLVLSDNLISDIEDDALGRLELLSTLFLDRNRLSRVPISLPSNLVYLYLQNNEIYELQPSVFRNLKNLRTLNLAGNRIAYLPELPLLGLVVLNVKRNDLKGLSQSVVKTSPNLRDFLLENNPVRCADLLGIAEWAKPCRDEMLFEDRNFHDSDDSGNEFDIFGRFTTGLKRDSNCKRKKEKKPSKMVNKIALFKSKCRNENLINLNAPNRLKSDQTTVKPPLQGDKIGPPITTETFSAVGTDMMNDKPGSTTEKSLLKNLMISEAEPSIAHPTSNTPHQFEDKAVKKDSKAVIISVEKKANINKNLNTTDLNNFTTVPQQPSQTLTKLMQLSLNNNTPEDVKSNKVKAIKKDDSITPTKKSPTKIELKIKQASRNPANDEKSAASSTVNKVVNLTAITPIVNVTGSERDEANDSSATIPHQKNNANKNSLIQADLMESVETSPHPTGRASTDDKLAEITLTAAMGPTLPAILVAEPSLRPTEEKYDTVTNWPTGVPLLTVAMDIKTTNVFSVSSSASPHQDDTEQTNAGTKDSLEQNATHTVVHPKSPAHEIKTTISKPNIKQKLFPVRYNATKSRKNVNHMKMKLKFNRDQLHDDEFRDNFDTEPADLLRDNFGFGHEHGNNAHRRSKFSIYDSIYLASLKNANFKPFHHSMHVPNASYSASRTAFGTGSSSNEGIPATSVETSSKILPQEWNDVRPVSNGGSHYGLFIVVGATLGMLISFGLFHLYYCRVRRGQHLHGHHHHYRQHPPHQSSSSSAHHRYSYSFEQDDSDERLTYTISTSVLDGPNESDSSPIHHQQRNRRSQQDVLHMDILNPRKSKPLSRNPSSSSSASSCFDVDSSTSANSDLGVLRPRPAYPGGYGISNQVPQPHSNAGQQHHNRNTSNNHNSQKPSMHQDNAIDRW